MSGILAGPEGLFDEYCYLKTSDWAYEREWRVLCFARAGESSPHCDWGFAPQALSEIILGPRVSDQDVMDIRALLTHRFSHVRISKAIPGSGNQISIEPV